MKMSKLQSPASRQYPFRSKKYTVPISPMHTSDIIRAEKKYEAAIIRIPAIIGGQEACFFP